jgi:hypothetical protein
MEFTVYMHQFSIFVLDQDKAAYEQDKETLMKALRDKVESRITPYALSHPVSQEGAATYTLNDFSQNSNCWVLSLRQG